jgi:sugar phosphate isomerase/epimerase
MTLLLTLAIQSLNTLIEAGSQDILEVPKISAEKLDLRGVMIDAKHLSGWGIDSYDKFRNCGDKLKSPCLLVRDNTSMDFLGAREISLERIQRLSVAANRLGCNAISITPSFPDDKSSVDTIVELLREAMSGVERLELNLLLQPCEGLSSDPDQLIEIIKQIGGFRIGALPTFTSVGATGNGIEALRKLAPYAGGIVADFPSGRGKKNIDPVEGLKAVREVGYSNTVALNYLGKGNALKEITKVVKKMRKYLEDEKK